MRIIAATNQDLATAAARGGFRRDLFYRLNVLTLRLPALRDRREDIPELVATMLARLEASLGRRLALTPAALALLCRYDFPGNVRELWNIAERVAVSAEADLVDVADLPPEVSGSSTPAEAVAPRAAGSLRRALEELEGGIVREALERCGTQALAAVHLGVSQATIARRAKRYNLGRRPSS